MIFRILTISSIALTLVLSGCATPAKMAYSDEETGAATETKPVFLMTATLRNNYKTSYQPKLIVVNVEKATVKDSADRINFTMDEKSKIETDSPTEGNSYLLRMGLEEGEYVIRGFTGMSRSFPIIASFFAPLHADLRSKESGVYYLGHVDATVRERNENEFKAGPTIPLLDQAVAGASGGTFDIEVSDQWDKDESSFRSKFPALSGVDIHKMILPAFDREKAQQWWETH